MKEIPNRHYYEEKATEEEYIAWYQAENKKKYEAPQVTADNVMLAYNRQTDEVKVLLIQRNTHPFKDSWALPGGFVRPYESTDDSCIRETFEETGVVIKKNNIKQLKTFSTPGRDPRGWIITVSYLAFIGEEPLRAGDDTSDAQWFSISLESDKLTLKNETQTLQINVHTAHPVGDTKLAFDHAQIILTAFDSVRNKMYHDPQVLHVLGSSFTVTDARKVFSQFLGMDYRDIDHSNFKKNLLPYINETDKHSNGIGRPAQYYTLKESYR